MDKIKLLYSPIKYMIDLTVSDAYICIGHVFQDKDGKIGFIVADESAFALIKTIDPESDVEFFKRYLGYMKAEFLLDTKPGNLRDLAYNYVNQIQLKIREVFVSKENLKNVFK